jgi:hypothetical protein
MMEQIEWRPASSPPESDGTVLLYHPTLREPVWPGYYAFGEWLDIEGFTHTVEVLAWAHMPKGSQK